MGKWEIYHKGKLIGKSKFYWLAELKATIWKIKKGVI